MKIDIIKVGGKVVETPSTLSALLDQIAGMGGNVILVHGGGRSATAMATRLGIETTMIDGRRVTDEAMLEIVTMVYAGKVNKNIVALLQARGVNAVGLTGADMNLITSNRRAPEPVDYGYVGDPCSVSATAVEMLLSAGIMPVIAPLTHDGQGVLLNTNADTIASVTAGAMAREGHDVTLYYCFEKPGVLAVADDDTSLISTITPADFDRLKADGIVTDGMIPKLDNAFAALHTGVGKVVVTSAANIAGGTVVTL